MAGSQNCQVINLAFGDDFLTLIILTIINKSKTELCTEYFLRTPCNIEMKTTESLFSGDKAKQLFGFEPRFLRR